MPNDQWATTAPCPLSGAPPQPSARTMRELLVHIDAARGSSFRTLAESLIDLKLDIAERRRPQDGKIKKPGTIPLERSGRQRKRRGRFLPARAKHIRRVGAANPIRRPRIGPSIRRN